MFLLQLLAGGLVAAGLGEIRRPRTFEDLAEWIGMRGAARGSVGAFGGVSGGCFFGQRNFDLV